MKIPYFVSSHQRKITGENHHKPQFSYFKVPIKGKSQKKITTSHNFHIFKEEFDLRIQYFVSFHQRKITGENHHKPQFSYFKVPIKGKLQKKLVISHNFHILKKNLIWEFNILSVPIKGKSQKKLIISYNIHILKNLIWKFHIFSVNFIRFLQFYFILILNIPMCILQLVKIFQKFMSSHYRVTIGILTILKLLGLPTIFKLFASSNLTSLLLDYLSTNIEAVSKLENR